MDRILRRLQNSRLTSYPRSHISRRIGENVINKEWDVLLVLDTLSVSITPYLMGDYVYIDSYSEIWSRGSSSNEWAENTFIRDDVPLNNVHYVTDNILSSLVLSGISERELFRNDGATDEHIEKYLDENDRNITNLKSVTPVWTKQQSTEDSDINNFEEVTQEVINKINASDDGDRVIGHYMKPHRPFVDESGNKDSVEQMNDGTLFNMSKDRYDGLVSAYRESHRYALSKIGEAVSQMNSNLDIAVTADHGNMYGNLFGIRYFLGHPEYTVFSRQLRKVPYMTVDSSYTKDTEINSSRQASEVDKESALERLENLGYR